MFSDVEEFSQHIEMRSGEQISLLVAENPRSFNSMCVEEMLRSTLNLIGLTVTPCVSSQLRLTHFDIEQDAFLNSQYRTVLQGLQYRTSPPRLPFASSAHMADSHT